MFTKPLRAQCATDRFGSAVRPDNCVVDRFSRQAVPDNGGFALVRDPDTGKISSRQARFAQNFLGGRPLRSPEFERVMLDPSGLRKDLAKLLLRHRND